MPKLSKCMKDLKPGLRKLLNFLNCLSLSRRKAPDFGGGMQVHPPATPGTDMPVPDAPETQVAPAPMPSSTTSTRPEGVVLGAGSSSETSQPQAREELTALDADALSVLNDRIRGAEAERTSATLLGKPAADDLECANSATAAGDLPELINGLFDKISVFSTIVEGIGEIHPYAKIVTTLIQWALKPLLNQQARDEAMDRLIFDMRHAYDVVAAHYHHLKGVKDDKRHPRYKLLVQLTRQTGECAKFIQKHYGTKGFVTRAAKNAVNCSVDDMIGEYSEAFKTLERMITGHDIISILDLVITLDSAQSRIEATLTLQDLQHAKNSGLQSSKSCLPGTRKATLDNLIAWIHDLDATRARFVVGVAGAGKSSIAHTIASQQKDFGLLGAFFAFNRNDKDLAPWSVFSSLARELAAWNADFKVNLHQALDKKPSMAWSRDVLDQWRELLVRPAQNVVFRGPVLIVIDALDESTDLDGPALAFDNAANLMQGRKSLLQCLTTHVGELPTSFRVLVTSRLERDVATALRKDDPSTPDAGTSPRAFDHLDLAWTQHDPTTSIELYFRHELSENLDDQQIRKLVFGADGLFEWAATACRYFQSVVGETTSEIFEGLFEGVSGILQDENRSLDSLYSTILGRLFPPKKTGPQRGLERFRAVMTQVLYAAEPLSISTLKALRGAVGEATDVVDLILPNLGSLLSGVGDNDTPIRPIHTSFRDFLTKTSDIWRVEPDRTHSITALGALRILNSSLHFNVCNLESSYTLNADIVGDRLGNLAAGLVYASRSWSYHISRSQSCVDLQTELAKFLTKKLLFWLELISLCGLVNRAASALHVAARFLKDSKAIDFVNDAILFVRMFKNPIRMSVPHIYLSALAFCPDSSLIRRNFVRDARPLPAVNALAASWPLAQDNVYSPGDWPLCMAYSPDGRYIVTGSSHQGDIRIADAENIDQTIFTILHEPGLWIWSAAYSPTDKFFVVGCSNGQVRRWNSETGEKLETLDGHTSDVRSVCFTPDGRYIISASDDKTILRWDARTGKRVGDPLRGHSGPVFGVTCSLDGHLIFSASSDATICVWNVQSGEPVGEPLSSPIGPLRSISRSPNSNRIAVGAFNPDEDVAPISILDLETHHVVGEPLYWHRGDVTSISWSTDGRWIASTSSDCSIRLWDTLQNPPNGITLHGSTGGVNAVVFSPDGQRIISGACDGFLRTWNVTAAPAHVEQEEASGPVVYAAFSPDGLVVGAKFFFAGGIYRWDVQSGAPLPNLPRGSSGVDSLSWFETGSTSVANADRQDHVTVARPGGGWMYHPIGKVRDISADSRRRASISAGSAVKVFNIATDTQVGHDLFTPYDVISSVALSPTGDQVVLGSRDGSVRIFRVDENNGHTSPLATAGLDMSSLTLRGGWLRDKGDHPIIYVPDQYQARIWTPGLRFILQRDREPAQPVIIDFESVGLGKEWTRCADALMIL